MSALAPDVEPLPDLEDMTTDWLADVVDIWHVQVDAMRRARKGEDLEDDDD